jgi:hypothetical protein
VSARFWSMGRGVLGLEARAAESGRERRGDMGRRRVVQEFRGSVWIFGDPEALAGIGRGGGFAEIGDFGGFGEVGIHGGREAGAGVVILQELGEDGRRSVGIPAEVYEEVGNSASV